MRIEEVMLSESCVYTDSLMESKAISRMREIASNYQGKKSELIAYQSPNNPKHYKVFVTGDKEQFWFELENNDESDIKKTTPKKMTKQMMELRSEGWKEVSTKNFMVRNWQKIVAMVVVGGIVGAAGGAAAAAIPIIANSVLMAIGELKSFITQPG